MQPHFYSEVIISVISPTSGSAGFPCNLFKCNGSETANRPFQNVRSSVRSFFLEAIHIGHQDTESLSGRFSKSSLGLFYSRQFNELQFAALQLAQEFISSSLSLLIGRHKELEHSFWSTQINGCVCYLIHLYFACNACMPHGK